MAGGVETFRYYAHPEGLGTATYPTLVRVTSILANLGYHTWNPAPSYKKAAASAFLGELGMPTVITIIGALIYNIWTALYNAIAEATAPSSQHMP